MRHVEHLARRSGDRGNQIGLHASAVLLEHLIARGQLQQVGLVGPQGHRQLGMRRDAGQSETQGDVADPVDADLLRQAHGDGVDRLNQRLLDGDSAAIPAAIVFRRPGADMDRGVHPGVRRLHPCLQGRRVDERFERRSRLSLRLNRAVEAAEAMVDAAHQGADVPVGTERHQRRLADPSLAALRLDHPAHHLRGGGLGVPVDRELHHQVGGLSAGATGGLALGHVQHIAEVRILGRLADQGRRRGDGPLLVGRRDPALLDHPPQHQPRTGHGGGHVVDRRQARGRLGQGGQQRRLGQGKGAGRLAEIGLGGGLHPIGAGPEEHPVQIKLEDLVTAEHPAQAVGQGGLLHLALQGLVRLQEQGLGQLLGQG